VAKLRAIHHVSNMQASIERLGFWPSLLIATSCGFILSLGAPPDGWLIGHWVGFVPLIVVARRSLWSWRQAVVIGLAGGMGVGLAGFPWIGEMLVRFARVPWLVGYLGLGLFSAWMAVPYAIWAVALRFGPREGWRSILWPVVAFVSLQALWPNLFPYTPLLGFAEQPEFMQLAELGGVHLVEAMVIISALFLALALRADGWSTRGAALALALAIPMMLYAYGSLRMSYLHEQALDARIIVVGVVQPNVPVEPVPADVKLERLRVPSAKLAQRGADVVIWPEAGAYPYGAYRPFRHDDELGDRRVLEKHSTPTIFGLNTRHRNDRFGYNSVYLLDETGEVKGGYDKVNLVPLGEYIPIIEPNWVTDRIPQIAHHHRGERVASFPVELKFAATQAGMPDAGSASLGPLICYEDIIPDFVREVAAQEGGVDLFVNVTIDAWYGHSAEPWEHLALAQFRSVEHRIPLVRSVSTGVSAIVDHTGRLVEHIASRPMTADNLDVYPPEMRIAQIRLPRNSEKDPTVYARFGWLFPHLCQLVALIMAGQLWLAARFAAGAD